MTNLLNGLCQGALLVALVWLLLKIVPWLNAATRYAIWWITFFAVIILPLRPLLVESASRQTQMSPAKLSPHNYSSCPPTELSLSKSDHSRSVILYSISRANLDETQPAFVATTSPLWAPIQLAAKPISLTILLLWGLAALALLSRLATSFFSLRRLKLRASPASKALQTRLINLSEKTGAIRQARLLVSDDVTTPMALGLFNPVILIPRSLPEQMSDPDFDHMALHELAHLRRLDDWANLLQQILIAILPIQPALFWLSRELTLERETACDDWVIAATGTPKPYAASLTRIAELTLWARCGVLATGAAGRPSQLYRRIHRLLDKRRNNAPRVSTVSLALALLAVLAFAWMTLNTPPMIALADSAPAADVASPSPVMHESEGSPSATQPSAPGTVMNTFTVQPEDQLVMDIDQGNIEVKGADQNTVGVVITQKGPGLAKYLKHHQITVTQEGHKIQIHATADSSPEMSKVSIDTDYQIAVPRKFHAGLKDGAGNVEIANLQGTLDLADGAGNLEFHEIDSEVQAHTGAGNIDCVNCAGTLQINTGAGNLDISKISASVDAHTGAGNIDALDCNANLQATAGQGNIEIGQFTGSSVTAHTGVGNIYAELLSPLKVNSSLVTGMGNVELKLNQTVAVNLDPSAGMGNVDSEFPKGAINGGGPTLRVKSGMGNVQISKK